MENKQSAAPLYVAVEQVASNTTAWVGHRPADDKEISAGQTFICPSDGDLGAIEIYSDLVLKPGHIQMTVHSFEAETRQWGPVLGSSSLLVDKIDSQKWISFSQQGLHLHKGSTYGFRLQSNDLYLGIGEAAGAHADPPYRGGQEWVPGEGNSGDTFYSYLSLAFKVELRA